MAARRFRDLPWPARAAIVAAGVLEVALLAAAQIDIARRPADRIRGNKLFWRLVSLINIAGPIAYFRRGRLEPSGGGRDADGSA